MTDSTDILFSDILFSLILQAVPIIGIIFLIVFFARRRHRGEDFAKKEDTMSQLFFLLSVFFFGVTLLAFNRDLGDIVSWRTILFFTSIAAIAIAYYFNVIYTVAFGLIALPIWWGVQGAEWARMFINIDIDHHIIRPSALLLGLVFIALIFYVAGCLHEKEFRYKHFARLYSLFGIFFVSGILFVLSTKLGLSLLENMTKGISLFGSWQIALSLVIFIISLVGLLFYGLNQKMISLYEVFVVAFFVILFGIIAFLSNQEFYIRNDFGGGDELSAAGILWAIVFNIVVFFELLGIIFSGYARREEWLVNLGAIFLFLLIVVKYFDWFFTSLDKSIFFIGAGILLLGVGWFMERGRRYVISIIKTESSL